MASAQSAAAPATKAARAKPSIGKPAPAPAPRTIKPLVAPVKPAPSGLTALATPAAPAAPVAKAALARTIVKIDPPTASALMQQYQHVGHDLVLLRSASDAKIGVELADAKASCAEVHAEFRLIKLDDAVKTPQSRLETKLLLDQLQRKIDRLRGVALSTDCMNNPLAKDCLGSEGTDDAPVDLSVPDDDAAPST